MAFALIHHFCGAVQALFGLDHLGCREAVIAQTLFAEFDQIGSVFDRPHHLVELIDPVAVAVREHRHVTTREGGLLMRDGVRRDIGIGDDAHAVIAGNLAVQFGTIRLDRLRAQVLFGFYAPCFGFDPLCRCTDLGLRFEVDALCFQRAMIDAGGDVEVNGECQSDCRRAFRSRCLFHQGPA